MDELTFTVAALTCLALALAGAITISQAIRPWL